MDIGHPLKFKETLSCDFSSSYHCIYRTTNKDFRDFVRRLAEMVSLLHGRTCLRHSHLLLKFTSEYNQRLFPVTYPLCVKEQYMQTVCGWVEEGVESCWRPYSTGGVHSVCEPIQNRPQDKNLDGDGASNRWPAAAKSFCRSLLRRRNFALPSMSLVFLRLHILGE
jgi:hypothetical protein